MADPKHPEGTYVCNVQTWGANPQYNQGDLIPDDCPYDVDAAYESGKIVPVAEYQQAHPEWDPEAEAKAKAQKKIAPGYDLPTAADPPDPVATKQMYDDAAAEAAGPQPKGGTVVHEEPKPTQVQQPSTPTKPSSSRS